MKTRIENVDVNGMLKKSINNYGSKHMQIIQPPNIVHMLRIIFPLNVDYLLGYMYTTVIYNSHTTKFETVYHCIKILLSEISSGTLMWKVGNLLQSPKYMLQSYMKILP